MINYIILLFILPNVFCGFWNQEIEQKLDNKIHNILLEKNYNIEINTNRYFQKPNDEILLEIVSYVTSKDENKFYQIMNPSEAVIDFTQCQYKTKEKNINVCKQFLYILLDHQSIQKDDQILNLYFDMYEDRNEEGLEYDKTIKFAIEINKNIIARDYSNKMLYILEEDDGFISVNNQRYKHQNFRLYVENSLKKDFIPMDSKICLLIEDNQESYFEEIDTIDVCYRNNFKAIEKRENINELNKGCVTLDSYKLKILDREANYINSNLDAKIKIFNNNQSRFSEVCFYQPYLLNINYIIEIKTSLIPFNYKRNYIQYSNDENYITSFSLNTSCTDPEECKKLDNYSKNFDKYYPNSHYYNYYNYWWSGLLYVLLLLLILAYIFCVPWYYTDYWDDSHLVHHGYYQYDESHNKGYYPKQ